MLARADMLFIKTVSQSKTALAGSPGGGAGERFTAVQEMKQHCSGLAFISSIMDGLCNDSSPLALIDLLGHDAWPAVYGLTRFSLGILALSHSMLSILYLITTL